MRYDPEIHHRYSTRLKGYDYSSAGVYFVTICVHQRECLFGEIVEGDMQLNDAGRMADRIWRALPERFTHVMTDEFIVMPNHIHGIVIVTDGVGAGRKSVGAPMSDNPSVGAPLAAPMSFHPAKNQGAASSAPTVGNIMRAFKSVSAIAVNRTLDRQGHPLWQRNYYERVIRNEEELVGIQEYISSNPFNWDKDTEHPP